MPELEKIFTESLYPNAPRPLDHRKPYERDRARIIHSAAFRRLQAKTQILGIGEGDYHRSRLTHSLEVAQIGQSISSNLCFRFKDEAPKWLFLLPNHYLIEAICLAHDLGHPPFGHAGEAALNYCMQDDGGFEGNGQTLRILTSREAHPNTHGLNLSRRTLLGILKYPACWEDFENIKQLYDHPPKNDDHCKKLEDLDGKPILSMYTPPKCYLPTEKSLVRELLEVFTAEDSNKLTTIAPSKREYEYGRTLYKTFDASIMELADDVAYGVHDLEDAISLHYISIEQLKKAFLPIDTSIRNLNGLGTCTELLDNLFNRNERKRTIGAIVNALIVSITVVPVLEMEHDLLRWKAQLSSDAYIVLDACKKIVSALVIKLAQVQQLDWRGQHIIKSLFVALHADAETLLKDNFREEWQSSKDKKRVICDYIAGMTDEYANRLYERLFVPRIGRVSDQL